VPVFYSLIAAQHQAAPAREEVQQEARGELVLVGA
jgi:hypothetical protein